MTTTLKATHPKARKEHRCWLCNETIPIGQIHTRQCTIDDGHMTAFRSHDACMDVLYREADFSDYDDGMAQGELRNILQDDPTIDLSYIKNEAERKRLEAIAHEFNTGDAND